MKSKLATLKTMVMINESDYILGNITQEEYKLNLINLNEKLKEIEAQNEQERDIKDISGN